MDKIKVLIQKDVRLIDFLVMCCDNDENDIYTCNYEFEIKDGNIFLLNQKIVSLEEVKELD